MKSVLFTSLLASTAMAAVPLGEAFGCGTHELTDDERANHQEAQAVEIASAGLAARDNLIINTYVNIVASTDAKARAITVRTSYTTHDRSMLTPFLPYRTQPLRAKCRS